MTFNEELLCALQRPLRIPRDHITINSVGRVTHVPVSEIAWFKADAGYVIAKHGGREVVLDRSETISALEDEFSDLFIRVHRNALVAMAKITELEIADRNNGRVYVDGDAIDVSRRHIHSVRMFMRIR